MQIAADEIEQGMCAHGGPVEECGDSTRLWYPQRIVCYPTMELAAANGLYDALHEKAPFHDGTFKSWSSERSKSHPYSFRDGVTIGLARTDLNPTDDFLS